MKVKFNLFLLSLLFVNLTNAQDEIFYSSFRPEGWDIYVSKDHGKNFSKFTNNESLDYDAKITPDGKWVVFTSERNGRPQLFIKSIDSESSTRQLMQSDAMQDQVDFSPDGKSMVFVSTHEGNADIYKIPFNPLDTLKIESAINLTKNKGGDFRPKFSNDGKYIAFSSDRAHDTNPLRWLIFVMQRSGDVYVMDADGENTKRLTESENWEGSPVWSNDDKYIYYYAEDRENSNVPISDIFGLHKMSKNGEDQQKISPDQYNPLSPFYISEEQILFSNCSTGIPTKYSILGLNPKTKEIDSSFIQPMDMMNVDYHTSGVMVYHGGVRPNENLANKDDFRGSLLVKNTPQIVNSIPEKPMSFYGVRRSFSAPPTNDNKIIYATRGPMSFQEAIKPYIYGLIILPILAIFWFVIGIVKSIKKRKIIAFWKHIIFSILSVLLIVFVLIQTYDKFIVFAEPINNVRTFLIIAFSFFILLSLLSYWLYKKKKNARKEIASLYKLYFLMIGIYSLCLLYMILFIGSFIKTSKDFYATNYVTNEVEHILKFKPDSNFNPQNASILDVKLIPGGEYVQFTVGGFRRSPKSMAGVYKYHLKNKTLELITDLDSNNGFADFSANGKTMVFRSGRTGNMDIYIKENDSIVNLTNSPDHEAFPVISADGNKVVFCSDVKGVDKNGIIKTVDIYLTERKNGEWSKPKQLTSYKGQEAHPHFSPDGKWVIYASEEYGINDEQPLVQSYLFGPQMYGEITAIRLSDKKKFRLTHNKWEDGAPLWKFK